MKNNDKTNKYLIDNLAIKRQEIEAAYYKVVALARLSNGASFCQDDIDRYWEHPKYYPPAKDVLTRGTRIAKIKWYIWNNTEELSKHFPWSHNFFLGLCECGTIKYGARFPRLFWPIVNRHVESLFKQSPFDCKISTMCGYSILSNNTVLSMKPDKESMEYMAGVLATGKVKVIEGKTYVEYSKRVTELLRKWKIPIDIEYKCGVIEHFYISPIWPTLMKKYMPPEESIRWVHFKHPANSEEFAFILWRIYVNKDPESGAFPYLKGRKTMFNKYVTIKNFEHKWLNYKLVELDQRFQKAILQWKKEFDEKAKEKTV